MHPLLHGCLVFLILLASSAAPGAQTFRVATYNVENYLDRPTETRRVTKSPEAKARVRESIRTLKPDIIALQEIGSVSALLELRDSLKAEGLDLPHWELAGGFDTNIHVAILSRFPFVARRPHTNATFLLSGRRFRTSRGFAEVDVRINPNYTLTVITAHLKSQRPIPEADEAEMRLEEAKILRGIVDKRLAANPNANIIVLGDFNSTKDTPPI
ncbi:MAG TPA: endonuclease/exonuclease/phosphatase family protein, partial [Verrucomicrobiota bacterium]|nr:endonuclease/exonuclease/phosphatase family protein [Verrucomicrobiota bacterium]